MLPAKRHSFLLLSGVHRPGQSSRARCAERFLLLSGQLSISSDHSGALPIGSDHSCTRFVLVSVVKSDRKTDLGRRSGGKRGVGVSGPRGIRRVLVANRGEIAGRVIRTCRRLGIETVLTVSDADVGSLPARLADKVIRIGPAPAADSYLNVDAVVGAALAAGVDALHPGYGFLSENARLARACAAAGIVFIGPAPRRLRPAGTSWRPASTRWPQGCPSCRGAVLALGATRPLSARRTGRVVRRTRVRMGRGATDVMAADAGRRGAAGLAGRIGFPVLVKAAGGGGGRGLRVVREPGELADAVSVASAEAGAAFGDARVYLERYVERGRHVEVQILGDGERLIHLGDRDCSVQRRYQKLIEEAPAPGLDTGPAGPAAGGRRHPWRPAPVPGRGHGRVPGRRRTRRVLLP